MRLNGKVAVVTGTASGIGAATGELLWTRQMTQGDACKQP